MTSQGQSRQQGVADSEHKIARVRTVGGVVLPAQPMKISPQSSVSRFSNVLPVSRLPSSPNAPAYQTKSAWHLSYWSQNMTAGLTSHMVQCQPQVWILALVAGEACHNMALLSSTDAELVSTKSVTRSNCLCHFAPCHAACQADRWSTVLCCPQDT